MMDDGFPPTRTDRRARKRRNRMKMVVHNRNAAENRLNAIRKRLRKGEEDGTNDSN